MDLYSKKLVEKYTEGRNEFKDTDGLLFEFVQRVAVNGKSILDLGCGNGRYTAKFLEMGAKSVKGIDISPAMIELAKKTYKNIDFVLGDCAELPYANESFDVVFSNFVLQHCEDLYGPMQEVERVLVPGGYFVATFNSVDTKNEKILNTEMPILLGVDGAIVVHDLIKLNKEYKDAISKAGLRVIEYVDEPNANAYLDPNFEFYSDIEKLKHIVCLLQK